MSFATLMTAISKGTAIIPGPKIFESFLVYVLALCENLHIIRSEQKDNHMRSRRNPVNSSLGITVRTSRYPNDSNPCSLS